MCSGFNTDYKSSKPLKNRDVNPCPYKDIFQVLALGGQVLVLVLVGQVLVV